MDADAAQVPLGPTGGSALEKVLQEYSRLLVDKAFRPRCHV